MTINLTVPQTMQELRPRITVVGVGGAGCNAVNNMIDANLEGVDFLVANTDGQSLAHSLASRKLQLGTSLTGGLGAGSKPEVGRKAAEESLDDVLAELADSQYGLYYRRYGRRYRYRGSPCYCQSCQRARHSDRWRGHKAVRFRRQTPNGTGR